MITDGGTGYPNSEPAKCCPLFFIRQYRRTPHDPWTNGFIEVQKKNRGTHLRMFLIEASEDWSKSFHFFACAYNTQPISYLHFSAQEIVSHTQPNFPMKSQFNPSRN